MPAAGYLMGRSTGSAACGWRGAARKLVVLLTPVEDSSAAQVRDGETVAESIRGAESLRRVKDDVTEVPTGAECGVGLACSVAAGLVREGDVLEGFFVDEVPATLS